MSGIARMTRERSRFRPSAAYLARIFSHRYSVHGDRHETEAGTFYCRGCDVFMPVGHFDPGRCHSPMIRDAGGHESLCRESLRAFYIAMREGDFLEGTYRPEDAPNCIIDQIAASPLT